MEAIRSRGTNGVENDDAAAIVANNSPTLKITDLALAQKKPSPHIPPKGSRHSSVTRVTALLAAATTQPELPMASLPKIPWETS